MKKLLQVSVAAFVLSLACPAFAADLEVAPLYRVVPAPWAPSWFVEGRLGASLGRFDDLLLLDPVGAALTPNSIDNYVLLTGKSLSDASFTGGVALGAFVTGALFVKASYEYLGSFRARGIAPIAGPLATNVSEELNTTASALLFGVGWDFHVTEALFVEATGGVGVGFLHSTGVQGSNAGVSADYLSRDHTNMAAGAGLGAGYYLTRNFGIMLSGNFYYLGRADTGITANPPAGMTPGEQLQAKLSVFTVTLGGRARF